MFNANSDKIIYEIMNEIEMSVSIVFEVAYNR